MKKKLVTLFVCAIILSLFVTLAACNKPDEDAEENMTIRLSTTTSVNDSGLMDYLMPYFEEDTGYKVDISSAGTGAAINAAKYGNADVILVHSKSAEETFVNAGFGLKLEGRDAERLSFMYNYFVLVGPEDDPAQAKDAANIKAAFAAIADGGHTFISRGDASGTHNKEVTLWPTALNITGDTENLPEAIAGEDGWYKSMGQGMGACLLAAQNRNAYVLTDKATYLAYKNNPDGDQLPGLDLLYEQDNDLKNTYTIIAVDPAAPFVDSVTGEPLAEGTVKINAKGAKAFADWMLSDRARELIAAYGQEEYGAPLFYNLTD